MISSNGVLRRELGRRMKGNVREEYPGFLHFGLFWPLSLRAERIVQDVRLIIDSFLSLHHGSGIAASQLTWFSLQTGGLELWARRIYYVDHHGVGMGVVLS
jgi:hypothetical protein